MVWVGNFEMSGNAATRMQKLTNLMYFIPCEYADALSTVFNIKLCPIPWKFSHEIPMNYFITYNSFVVINMHIK